MAGRSHGEALFSAYLRQRRLPFDHEPRLGRRHPDFLVHHPVGDVVCEVFEPVRRLGGGGAIDPYAHLRRAFRGRKRKQGAEAKRQGVPYVLVLARSSSDMSFDGRSVTGAMFGNHGIVMPFAPDRGAADPRRANGTFLGGAELNAGKNTRYSAVAVVTRFNPTLHRVQRAYQDKIVRYGIPPSERPPVIFRAYEDAHDSGVYDDAAAVARLTVYHNPFAAAPLPREAFGGPHDQQWDAIEHSSDRSLYSMVTEGRRCSELPRESIG